MSAVCLLSGSFYNLQLSNRSDRLMKPEDREEETTSSLKEVCPLGGSGERRSSRLEGSPKLKARFEDNLHKD